MYFEEQPYEFEPTEMDELFSEMKNKMKDMLSDDIKNHLSSIDSREQSIKKQLEQLQDKRRELDLKERELNNKERELNKGWDKKKLSDFIDPIAKILKHDVFVVEHEWLTKDKCEHCDDKRKIMVSAPHSTNKLIETSCECSEQDRHYVVRKSSDRIVKLWDTRNSGIVKITKNYSESEAEFKNVVIVEKFDDSMKTLSWDEIYGFESIEEAQKLADKKNADLLKPLQPPQKPASK